ncbi:hypothetical protein EQU24_04225 [Methylotuvimicrobium buryatense]|uniref:Uncharacterized protein n=1 Tax=Methylotuvimicrobium buryatense TaxID=95641 RepID=A0A4P9UPQ6_METBY|nr:hypothetical protein EQU24_04225 [Methylotuvimicrobium buryatense]
MLIVLDAVVSFRSVPRILELFHSQTSLELPWTPHFTSVINWSLRVGLGLLRQVCPTCEPWIAIIDYSIDIGTKKALVVLRVKTQSLRQRGSAIQLQDCECIGLKVRETVNHQTVCQDLEDIFAIAGVPQAIVKDCDYTLAKGVRHWSAKQGKPVPVIDDIGHCMASALKSQFEKTADYKAFTAALGQGAKCLRQTEFACLTPPKLRTKGRFQSISKLGEWGAKMLDVFAVKGGAKKGSVLAKLRTVFPGFLRMKPFIERFALTTKIVSEVMEIIKNKGLNKVTYQQCYQLSKTLPRNSKVKTHLQAWLKKHVQIQAELTELPLLSSSDIIETLFGNYKYMLERSPQADMNRSVLLIPALCGSRKEAVIDQALNKAFQVDLAHWEEKNIPYTVRKKRQEFFKHKSQKSGKIITD